MKIMLKISFMDRRSMMEGDYAYYGAPYGYEEIYQAAYPIGAIAQNGRVPFYPDAYQGAYQAKSGFFLFDYCLDGEIFC